MILSFYLNKLIITVYENLNENCGDDSLYFFYI